MKFLSLLDYNFTNFAIKVLIWFDPYLVSVEITFVLVCERFVLRLLQFVDCHVQFQRVHDRDFARAIVGSLCNGKYSYNKP